MAPNKDVKCYRRPSGSSPRRRFHTFTVKTRVPGSDGSGRRGNSDSPRAIAADGGAVLGLSHQDAEAGQTRRASHLSARSPRGRVEISK